MFAVDPTIHWANPNSNSTPASPFPAYPPGYPNAQTPVPLVTHLHGGENQSYSDGAEKNGSPRKESMAQPTTHMKSPTQTQQSTTIPTVSNPRPFGTTTTHWD